MTAPTVFIGYFNNQEETTKILLKHKDGKLWLHSGDTGYMDELPRTERGKIDYRAIERMAKNELKGGAQ